MTAPLAGRAATVYPKPDPRTGAPLMVKVFHRPFDQQTRGEIAAEQAALATLTHVRSILPSVCEELSNGFLAIRMPRCPQSLAQQVRASGPLPVDRVLAVAETVTLALAAAHRAGVVHGAVHPHNVLVTAPSQQAPEVVLADFGVAARRTYGQPTGEHLGFTAPETLRDGTLDQRTDVYGIGVVLYFALTGRSPYPVVTGEPDAQRILRILKDGPPTVERDDLPAAARELIGQLLATEPGNRPDSASAVANRLTVLLAGGSPERPVHREGPVRRPAGPPVAVFRPERKQRRVTGVRVAALVGVILIAGILAAVLLIGDQGAPPTALPAPPSGTESEPPSRSDRAGEVVRLAVPTVADGYVELRWNGPPGLDYVVWFREGWSSWEHRIAKRRQDIRLPVKPGREYCFRVEGSSVDGRYTSRQLGLDGSSCD